MLKRLVTLVMVIATNTALVRGQSVDAVPMDDVELNRIALDDAEAAELAACACPPRTWFRAEFLLWWIKPASLPPLVTTGPFTELRPGALDSLETQVLFGQSGMDYQDRTGGRFTFGYWLDDDRLWNIDASYFLLRGRSIGHASSSPGAPVLATPFFNLGTGMQDSSLVTFPGIMSGEIVIDAPSFLHGAEANVNGRLWITERLRWDASLGARYLNLNEQLNINAVSSVQLAPNFVGFGIPFDGNTIRVTDMFHTRNNFYGAQLGTHVELDHKRWTLIMSGKVALGVTHEIAKIRSVTSIDTQPAILEPAGLFAVATNSGRFTHSAFAVVPEVNMTLKFQLTERLRLFGGYSFLYWSHVARPADQIDAGINPNLVPTSATYRTAGGPARPAMSFRQTSFFAHGANFGLEFRY